MFADESCSDSAAHRSECRSKRSHRQKSVPNSPRPNLCFVASSSDYDDELDRKGYTISGLFVAAATKCQIMARDLSMQVQ